MRIVLDTNVLVSGLLSPFGPPGEIVRLAGGDELALCYDARLLTEYREVLARPRFGFDPVLVARLLDHVRDRGLPVAAVPLPKALPDPDDEPFVEVGLAGGAACLVTGNTGHYPGGACLGLPVLAPAAFAAKLRSGRLTDRA